MTQAADISQIIKSPMAKMLMKFLPKDIKIKFDTDNRLLRTFKNNVETEAVSFDAIEGAFNGSK